MGFFFSNETIIKTSDPRKKYVIYKHKRSWTIWLNVWKRYATKEKMFKKKIDNTCLSTSWWMCFIWKMRELNDEQKNIVDDILYKKKKIQQNHSTFFK